MGGGGLSRTIFTWLPSCLACIYSVYAETLTPYLSVPCTCDDELADRNTGRDVMGDHPMERLPSVDPRPRRSAKPARPAPERTPRRLPLAWTPHQCRRRPQHRLRSQIRRRRLATHETSSWKCTSRPGTTHPPSQASRASLQMAGLPGRPTARRRGDGASRAILRYRRTRTFVGTRQEPLSPCGPRRCLRRRRR